MTVNMSKADSQYVKDALTIEDEYESELAEVQVALTRFEVAPHEYAERRAEIAARAYLKLVEAHQAVSRSQQLKADGQRATRR